MQALPVLQDHGLGMIPEASCNSIVLDSSANPLLDLGFGKIEVISIPEVEEDSYAAATHDHKGLKAITIPPDVRVRTYLLRYPSLNNWSFFVV